jgi:hypothetical protein
VFLPPLCVWGPWNLIVLPPKLATLGLEVVWLINVEPVGGYIGLCLLLWILSFGGIL